MSPTGYLLAVTLLSFYCTGASWLLQYVSYPGYRLVGELEFVPFHVDFGKRLIPVTVLPMVGTNLLMLGLPFFGPGHPSSGLSYVVAGCSLVILLTTALLEVPKHNQLDREGKSLAVIQSLVRNNVPRTACWTIGSLILGYLCSQQL